MENQEDSEKGGELFVGVNIGASGTESPPPCLLRNAEGERKSRTEDQDSLQTQDTPKDLTMSNCSTSDSYEQPQSTLEGLHRSLHLFPGLQFPFAKNPFFPPASDSEQIRHDIKDEEPEAEKLSQPTVEGDNFKTPSSADFPFPFLKLGIGNCNHDDGFPLGNPLRKDLNASLYQVKWSNHASRLASFIGALEGDIFSSDTLISAKDGTTFNAHRLVLASASPFFMRTLKNLSRDQQAVVVIPRASSRCISSVLSFCYTGAVVVSGEDLKPVFELAEDLEITGLLAQKHRQTGDCLPKTSTPVTSRVFTFNPPSIALNDPQKEPAAGCGPLPVHSVFSPSSPADPSSTPMWKRVLEKSYAANQPSMKRIKSDSEVQKTQTKKIPRIRFSDSTMSKPQRTPSLLQGEFFPQPSSPQSISGESSISQEDFMGKSQMSDSLTSRQIGTGSRVLLWKFLLGLLHDQKCSPYYIRWLDKSKGIFRIMESDKVAQLWGEARKNKNMTYEKMSRGMRTYYKRSILFHEDGTKLIYRFNIQEPEIQHELRTYELLSLDFEKDQHYLPSPGPSNTSEYISLISHPNTSTSEPPSSAEVINSPLMPNMYDLEAYIPAKNES